MTNNLNAINSLPDISFIDGITLEDIRSQLLNDFAVKYEEITGKKIQISKADPNRIIMLACAQLIYQGLQSIDKAGKMNFLKYAYADYLENLASLKRIKRNPAKHAQAPVKFTLSAKREAATSIPAGTRVTSNYEAYFATIQYAEIPAGEMDVTVMTRCTQAGEVGNDYATGELNTLVDPIGFIASVTNTDKSTGGAEIESDEDMAERIYLAPSSYSTAGPDDAYEYWVRESNQDIGDVKITSPTPGVVDIRFVMADGAIPDDNVIAEVLEAVDQRGKRPLTDRVLVKKPDTEEYEIDVVYYINASESAAATAIQSQADIAVEEYKIWQASKVGRDINPDELIARMNKAGVKRAVVKSPVFRVIGETAKAQCVGVKVVYGGLEDD